ncbi:50S ribosomal protein L35 [Ureaplasma ceti]|uniref:Large ribosomal subunit protein bL35 n=1 Tax=Ureaplasma ceti TaxID=3119530 RepID=A0ABP9U8N0_9BACT
MKIKQKTKRAAAKRFSETKSGELKRKHAYRSHLAQGRSTKAKRHLRKDSILTASDRQRYSNCL